MPSPRIIVSAPMPVNQEIFMKDLGKDFSNLYMEVEFSNLMRFRKSDLIIPTTGSIQPFISPNNKSWGSISTPDETGIIAINTGDYVRGSAGGIVEFLKANSILSDLITDALFWRIILQRS